MSSTAPADDNGRAEKIRKLAIMREPAAVRTIPAARLWLAAALLAAGATAGYLLQAALGGTVAAPPAPIPASAGGAAAASVAQTPPAPAGARFEAQGFVTATRRATVSTLVAGIVTAIPVAVGARVERGQILGLLDDTSPRQALALVEKQRDAAATAIAGAKARLELAESEYQQEKALVAQQFSSANRLAQKKTALDVAVAALASAVADREALQLQVQQQRTQLSYYTIRAPFAGIVTDQNAQPGELIAPSGAGGGFTRTGICTIVDTSTLEVMVDVSEQMIRLVQVGAPATLALYAYEGKPLQGRVSRIMPSADRAKGTLQVRISLLEPDPRVLPDMRVRVHFL